IQEDLSASGIAIGFIEPFCILEGSQNAEIDLFAKKFGRPQFVIRMKGGLIAAAQVVRDTPCGSATSVGRRLVGMNVDNPADLARKCYDEHHNEDAENYCLAEMDPLCPLMQEAADLLKDAVFEAVGLPTTKEVMFSLASSPGGISRDRLRDLVVDAGCRWEGRAVGCTTRRAFDLYCAEMVRDGTLEEDASGRLTTGKNARYQDDHERSQRSNANPPIK
ncbi:MAG: DUF166 domain-containing protein, partial [Methanoregulaceae archaeon]|nr:DUF166 domain-containing protein [Methanoregulaceae archaeon]